MRRRNGPLLGEGALHFGAAAPALIGRAVLDMRGVGAAPGVDPLPVPVLGAFAVAQMISVPRAHLAGAITFSLAPTVASVGFNGAFPDWVPPIAPAFHTGAPDLDITEAPFLAVGADTAIVGPLAASLPLNTNVLFTSVRMRSQSAFPAVCDFTNYPLNVLDHRGVFIQATTAGNGTGGYISSAASAFATVTYPSAGIGTGWVTVTQAQWLDPVLNNVKNVFAIDGVVIPAVLVSSGGAPLGVIRAQNAAFTHVLTGNDASGGNRADIRSGLYGYAALSGFANDAAIRTALISADVTARAWHAVEEAL